MQRLGVKAAADSGIVSRSQTVIAPPIRSADDVLVPDGGMLCGCTASLDHLVRLPEALRRRVVSRHVPTCPEASKRAGLVSRTISLKPSSPQTGPLVTPASSRRPGRGGDSNSA